jgi:hypothetical protein
MLLYETELRKLKDIYDHLRPASKEMVRPILAMPPVVMGVFGIVLVPFGVLNPIHVLGLGVLATLVAAGLIYAIVDVKQELARYNERMAAERLVPPVQKRAIVMAAANDPAPASAEAAATKEAKGL